MRVLALVLLASCLSSALAQTPGDLVSAWPSLPDEARTEAMQSLFAGTLAGPSFTDAPEAYVPLLALGLRAEPLAARQIALTVVAFGGIGVQRGMIGPGAFDTLAPHVVRSAAASDPRERAAAYGALLALRTPELMEVLARGVRDADLTAAAAALGSVYVLGPAVRDALYPSVLAVTRTSTTDTVKGAALGALGALFRDTETPPAALPPEALAVLRAALRDTRVYVQQEGLRAVTDIGSNAQALRADVQTLATHPPASAPHLAGTANAALRRLDGVRSTRDPGLR